MSRTERDTNRIVHQWLEEGVTALPDRILDDVLGRLPATPQRRPSWLARRFPPMNTAVRVAIAAVAVVAIAFLGIRFLGPADTGSPIETASPNPSPSPEALLEGARGPGTFTTTPLDGQSTQFTFDMPAGWQGGSEWMVAPVGSGDQPPDGSALLFLQVSGLYSDPCRATGVPDVSVGTTADELAAALMAQTAYEATLTTTLEIDGHGATRLELVTPSDLDYATCTDGLFRVWDGPPGSSSPNRWYLWILEIDGTPAVLLADVSAATGDHEAQIEQMVLSLQIEP